MRRHKIKRARPTLKTAHDFFKEGSFSVDPKRHYFSDEERKAEIDTVTSELSEIVKRQFPRTRNLEYAILKSHLIVEHALVQYIKCFSAVAVSLKEIPSTFRQKLEMAYLFGFGANDPILLPTIDTLNRVRNQVAHTFTVDRRAVDELLRINHDDYNAFRPKNDIDRVRCLRWICIYICGRVAGKIEAEYHLALHDVGARSDLG